MAKTTDPFVTDPNAPQVVPDQPADLTNQVNEDPELGAVKAGKMKPYQVTSPTARKAAYDWYTAQSQPRRQGPAAGYQAPTGMEQWQAAQNGNAAIAGPVPTTPQLWEQGGFADPNAMAELERVRSGQIRPDEIQNPTARAAAYRMLQEDPQFANDFRTNHRAQYGLDAQGNPQRVRADPEVMRQAQSELDAMAGTGRPSLRDEAEAAGMTVPEFIRSGMSDYGDGEEATRIADRIERKANERAAREAEQSIRRKGKVLETHAKRIANMPPEKWANEIGKFNRMQARAGSTKDGSDRAGLFLTPDDIARAGSRAFAPRGIEGTFPLVNGEQSRRSGRGADDGLIRTPGNGTFRPQQIGGKPMGVPVLEMPDGAVPDPSGLSPDDFGKAYTSQDAAITSRSIYSGGTSEWAVRQRRIDAARASLSDGSLTDGQKAQARLQLQREENDLHREYLMADGMRASLSGGRGMEDMTDPRIAEKQQKSRADRNEKVQGLIDKGYSQQEAEQYVDSLGTDKASFLTPRPKEEKAKAKKPEFQYSRFIGAYQRAIREEVSAAAKAKPANAVDAYKAKLDGASEGPTKEMKRRAMLSAIAATNERDRLSTVDSFDSEIAALAAEAGTGRSRSPEDTVMQVEDIIRSHLPMFTDRINDPDDDQGIETLAKQIVKDRIVTVAKRDARDYAGGQYP